MSTNNKMGDPQNKPAASEGMDFSRLIGGSAFIFACRVAGAGLTFLIQVLLARWMGATELGIYVLAFSWCILLSSISTGGFQNAANRFIGIGLAGNDAGYVRGFLRRGGQCVLAISLLTAVAAIAYLYLDQSIDAHARPVFLLAFVALPLFAQVSFRIGAAMAFSRYALHALPSNVVRPLLVLLGLAFFWYSGQVLTAESAMLLQLLAITMVSILTYVWLRSHVRRTLAAQTPRYATRLWVHASMQLLALSLFSNFFPELSVILVGLFLPSDSVAVFHVCFRTAMLIGFGLQAIDAFVGPHLARMYALGDTEGLQQATNRATQLQFWPSLLALILVGLAGRQILGIFGSEFVIGYPVLLVLAAAQLVRAATGPVGRLISVSEHQHVCVQVFAGTMLAAVLLMALLVPRYQIFGGALAAFLSITLWCLWLRVLVVRHLGIRPSIFGGRNAVLTR